MCARACVRACVLWCDSAMLLCEVVVCWFVSPLLRAAVAFVLCGGCVVVVGCVWSCVCRAKGVAAGGPVWLCVVLW